MVPHASRANGHIATKQDQIPIIWGMGTLESGLFIFQAVPMMELKAGGI
jgi:hypothetical protein